MLYTWQFWLVASLIVIVVVWIFRDRGPVLTTQEVPQTTRETSPPVPVIRGESVPTAYAEYCSHCGQALNTSTPPRSTVTSTGTGQVVTTRESPLVPHSPTSPRRSPLSSREGTPSLSGVSEAKVPLSQVDLTPSLPAFISEPATTQTPGSKPEEECRRVLEAIYGARFPRVRPAWLLNDRTGKRMELDGYCQEVGVAFEYNGEQHYKSRHPFNRSLEAFRQQVYRDNLKVDICDRYGIYLITIPYCVPISKIEAYIRYYLPEAVVARETTARQGEGHQQ